MVARTIQLPNVRRMFIPDDGYMILDIDLERADAQVVAWEADDIELKDIFRSGADVHRENAAAVFRVASKNVTPHQRQQSKQGVHATNYDSSAKTLAAETGMTVAEAEFFQRRWFEAHPKIKHWHQRIKSDLERTRTVRNAFGYAYTFLDRLSIKTFHEALAWIPQSTVAIATNLGLINIDKNLPIVQLLLQVHDSLVMQVPLSKCPSIFPTILSEMQIEIPYPDPLTIPTSLSASHLSWGDVFPLSNLPKLISLYENQVSVSEIAKTLETTSRVVNSILENQVVYGAEA